MARKRKKIKGKKKDDSVESSGSKEPSFNPALVKSLLQLLFWSGSVLTLISFSRQGSVLINLNDALLSYVGWTALFLPFILLSAGFSIGKHKAVLGRAHVVIGSTLAFLSIMALTGSGDFGSSAGESVAALLSPVGAFFMLLILSVAGILIMLNVSLDQLFSRAGVGEKEELSDDELFQKEVDKSLSKDKKSGGLFGKPKLGLSLGLGGGGQKKELKILGGSPQFNKKETESAAKTDGKPITTQGADSLWNYPPIDLFSDANSGKADRGNIKVNADTIERTLSSFGIDASVVEVNQGPSVTQYAIEVTLGTKLSKITALDRDLARALESPTGAIRIEAPIPGRSLVGIELPNKSPEFVPLRRMLASDPMRASGSKLSVAMGLDVAGKPVIADIGKMPHVLIAGQTGSGKSVCINTFLTTLLFRASPSEVKLILVDPKRVELTGYNGIPHLLAPVIVEPDKVLSALRWLVGEMDRRYKLFAQAGVRNIASYNEMSGFQAMPFIVVFIDELADIMLFAPVEVEDCITRLAQMSRAVGIHMVLATQRPSVDVLTGLIKANVPHRIAFAVSSQVDSRVILDSYGAEKLLGKGDMLHLSPDQARPKRIQGAFVSDKDVNKLVDYLKSQGVDAQYAEEVTTTHKPGSVNVAGVEDADDMFAKAVEIVCQFDRASASLLQRKLSIGYSRAARIIDQLQEAGVIGQAEGSKPREVLIKDPKQVLGGADNESSSSV